ncbi:MAG TPA: transposase [Steroidobacteraceae bacterium]
MPRARRSIHAGCCYHVINRGNNRAAVFHRAADYSAFIGLIRAAQQRRRLDLLGACLMPNHFHLVVRTAGRDDIGAWMHWLLTTHAHRYHLANGTSGRVWQGRYKAFPIEQGAHLLTVLRYVERNAVRAGFVERARDWRWGSAAWRHGPASRTALLASPPATLPPCWDDYVDLPQTEEELESMRACVNGQRPYGSSDWIDVAPECQGFLKPQNRPPGRRASRGQGRK